MNSQIFAAGILGRNRAVTTQRRLNYYYGWDLALRQFGGNPVSGPDRADWAIFDRPPLTQVLYLGASRMRGMLRFGGFLYVVQGGTLWQVNPNFSAVPLGALLSAAGRVTMDAIQGLTGFEVAICDYPNVYVYNLTTGVFSQIAGAPASSSLSAGHSYLLTSSIGSGQVNASAIGDGTTWPGQNFSNADSDPDNLVAVKHYTTDVLHLFGERSTEFWSFAGVGTFPWQRVAQSVAGYGLASRDSIAPFGKGLICLAQVATGGGPAEVQVCRVENYQFTRVSTPDLEHLLNGYPDISAAEGCSWTLEGHLQYRLFFPQTLKSWMYDDATSLWSEESSFGGTSLAPAGFGPHRGVLAAGFNNQVVFGDYADGSLWIADPRKANYADTFLSHEIPDQPIERELIGKHIFGTGNPYQTLAALEIDCNMGDGIAASPAVEPRCMLSVSRDKGHTFSKERYRGLGAVGQYSPRRVRFPNLGRARDLVVKFRVTDPVRCIITGEVLTPGGAMRPQQGAA